MYPEGTLGSILSEQQMTWWNQGLDWHPRNLEDCPYPQGSEAYSYFEDGWWYADNE